MGIVAYRVWLAAGVLLLTGCTAPVVPTASPPQASATVSPGSTSPSVLPVPDYSGPLPMPASDGKPMLWPAPTAVTIEDHGYRTEGVRYGFVDTAGQLRVAPRYEGYQYCDDDTGRAASIIGTAAGRKAEVLDLTGTVLRRLPTDSARCGPTGTVVFTREGAFEGDDWRDGLIEVGTGKVLVPLAPKRHIDVVDDHTANVSEPRGEYFLDTRTGRRTPHPGEVADAELEAGAPGVPAGRAGDGVGYVALDGTWLGVDGAMDASRFHRGFATIQIADELSTFIDTGLNRLGGEWTEIDWVAVEDRNWEVVGYVVTGASGRALLGPDLRTIIEPGPAEIRCAEDGACSVLAADGISRLVVLPEGTVTVMPDGFSQALSRSFLADRAGPDDLTMSRVHALGSGRVSELAGPSYCRGVGAVWALCEPESQVLPTVVLDAQGRRTAFRSVQPVTDAVRGGGVAYYWVTTGRYAGFVDEHGAWRYRQGRFTQLED